MCNKSWKIANKYNKDKYDAATTPNTGKHDASHGRRTRMRVSRYKSLEEKLLKKFPGSNKKKLRDTILVVIKVAVFHIMIAVAITEDTREAVKAAYAARVQVCFNM